MSTYVAGTKSRKGRRWLADRRPQSRAGEKCGVALGLRTVLVLPCTEPIPPRDQTLVDAVASLTADARLVYLFGSFGTAHERPDCDLDVAALGCSGPLDVEARTSFVERLGRATG